MPTHLIQVILGVERLSEFVERQVVNVVGEFLVILGFGEFSRQLLISQFIGWCRVISCTPRHFDVNDSAGQFVFRTKRKRPAIVMLLHAVKHATVRTIETVIKLESSSRYRNLNPVRHYG